jgi:hypothetical protein
MGKDTWDGYLSLATYLEAEQMYMVHSCLEYWSATRLRMTRTSLERGWWTLFQQELATATLSRGQSTTTRKR